jgi:hypothetical protein
MPVGTGRIHRRFAPEIDMVVARLGELESEAALAGVWAEINRRSMLSHEQALHSLRLQNQGVAPQFK